MSLNKIHSHSFGNVCSTSKILRFLPYSQRERQLTFCSVIDKVNPKIVFGGTIPWEVSAGSCVQIKQTLLPLLFSEVRRVEPPIFILQTAWLHKLSWICDFWPAKATCKCGLAFKIRGYRESLGLQSLVSLCCAVTLPPDMCWCCRMSPKKN